MVDIRFTDSFVFILVGPGKTLFKVSKELLFMHSEYCQAAFSRNSNKVYDGMLRLEDEDADTFEACVKWLYNIDGSRSKLDALAKPDRWDCYLNLYVLANRLCILDLQNQVIDVVIAMVRIDPPSFAATRRAWDRMPPGCKLREFLLDFAAQQAMLLPPTDITKTDDTIIGRDYLAEFGKRSLLTYLSSRHNWAAFATTETQRCRRYHVHSDNEKLCKEDSAAWLMGNLMREAGV